MILNPFLLKIQQHVKMTMIMKMFRTVYSFYLLFLLKINLVHLTLFIILFFFCNKYISLSFVSFSCSKIFIFNIFLDIFQECLHILVLDEIIEDFHIILFLSLGVSCDSCMKTNFPGRRYKCLLCDNYDLCGSCYDAEAESQNHKNDHPMQCILTETASG